MTDKIMAAISRTLDRAFEGKCEVYFSRDLQQGVKEPCFFISLLSVAREKRIGERYRQTNPFAVQYFPREKRGNFEMLTVGQKLMDALEMIELTDGDRIRGEGMNFNTQDGVLHFFVDYNVFLKRRMDATKMQTVETQMHTT